MFEDTYKMVEISPRMAERIIEFCNYLDTAVNLEPAGPSRNRDFHMLNETSEITKTLRTAYAKATGVVLR